MILDFHTHIFPDDVLKSRDRYIDDPGFKQLYSDPASRLTDSNGLTGYISGNGLSGAVAMSFPWNSENHALRHNEYMASISSASNIYPFGTVPMSGQKSILSYAEEIKSCGLYGIGEIAFYNGGMTPENIKYLRGVLEAAASLTLPVCLHVNEPVGHKYAGKYDPSLRDIYEILKEVPDAKVVLSHWGGGLFLYELMPEVYETLKNVFYDTAATPYLYTDAIYSTSVKITGADKIIFGSDFPLLGLERYRGSIEKQIPSEDDRVKIFSQNAERILGL